jgi:hypothetical protein
MAPNVTHPTMKWMHILEELGIRRAASKYDIELLTDAS